MLNIKCIFVFLTKVSKCVLQILIETCFDFNWFFFPTRMFILRNSTPRNGGMRNIKLAFITASNHHLCTCGFPVFSLQFRNWRNNPFHSIGQRKNQTVFVHFWEWMWKWKKVNFLADLYLLIIFPSFNLQIDLVSLKTFSQSLFLFVRLLGRFDLDLKSLN